MVMDSQLFPILPRSVVSPSILDLLPCCYGEEPDPAPHEGPRTFPTDIQR